jgi:hypothetical protein
LLDPVANPDGVNIEYIVCFECLIFGTKVSFGSFSPPDPEWPEGRKVGRVGGNF